MTAIAQPVNTRPFMMIHLDCFNSKIFDNQSQRTVYMTLKQFADANNQCFPGVEKIASVAILSKRAVQKALRALQNKLLIGIDERFRSDGSQTSNLYTIYDSPGLWTAGNAENTGNVKNAKNTKNVNDVNNTGNAGNAKNIKNTNDVNNIENANNNDNKTETTKITIEQYKEFVKEFMSMMETEGYVLIKKDDIPTELQDKFTLKSASETVSDNTIMAQDESTEENNITEIEEAMPEDAAVQEKVSISNTAMPEKENSTIGKKFMSKLKNITRKEKTPTSTPTKATDVSPHTTSINSFSNNENDTMLAPESQPLEKYSLDWIKNHFDYDAMIDKYPEYKKNIDSVMHILYTTMNTTNKIIRIKGDKKPSMVVKSKLLKLENEDIIYAIKTFLNQKVKIKNTTAYMITLLYNAPEQRQLDMENAKQHDIAKKNGQASESNETQSTATTLPLSQDIYPRNQFHQFMERKTTQEELDELERALLGNLHF